MNVSGSTILLYQKTNLFITCLKNNLYYVKDILAPDDSFKSLDLLNQEFNVNLNFLDYLRIRQCIPHTWKQILHNKIVEDKTTDILFNKMKRYKTLKCNTIYWLIMANTHNTTIHTIQLD
jgi:hypothetical protein